jgi:hypothetical protein
MLQRIVLYYGTFRQSEVRYWDLDMSRAPGSTGILSRDRMPYLIVLGQVGEDGETVQQLTLHHVSPGSTGTGR